MEQEAIIVKHPSKGHTPNKGQRPMYQGVRYSETPLYSGPLFINLQVQSMNCNAIITPGVCVYVIVSVHVCVCVCVLFSCVL